MATEDPLVEARRQHARQEQHDKLYWQAFHMLHDEFVRALGEGARAEVATPHDPLGETTPLVNVVLEVIDSDEDDTILIGLLECVWRASQAGDPAAQQLVERMAGAHAAYYTSEMNEAGDLQP